MTSVPFVIFILLFLQWRRRLTSWRDAFLAASILWAVVLLAITEILSSLNGITPVGLFSGWCVGGGIACLATFRVSRLEPAGDAAKLAGWFSRSAAVYVGVIALVLALVAWIGPPNNTDAMSYHLPRVTQWMQNRNVEFFPVQFVPPQVDLMRFYGTQEIRQLTMPPGAEYIILNLRTLSGSERVCTMVQWFAYVGCLIGVWSIAELLGAAAFGQTLAVLFAATLPSAALEATTAQNDLVCAFWMICLVWATLCIHRRRGAVWFNVSACGASLGLALLTKGTAYIFAAPILLALAAIVLQRLGRRGCFALALVASLAVLINLRMYIRDYQLGGVLLGSATDNLLYPNASLSAGNTVSNVLRNLYLELAAPVGGFPRKLQAGVMTIHQWLGLDANDPDTTFPLTSFHAPGNQSWFNEDNAPNPFHLVLLLLIAPLTITGRRHWGWLPALYLLAIVMAFVAFCAYLRWQPWHSRLLLPLMLLAAPVAGLVMEQWNKRLAIPVASFLALAVIPWIVFNHHHPLVGPNAIYRLDRQSRLFITDPAEQAAYQQVVDAAVQKNCRQVGIISAFGEEYPLDEMLKERLPAVRIEAYPQQWNLNPNTVNHGWDPNLKPNVVIRFDDRTPKLLVSNP